MRPTVAFVQVSLTAATTSADQLPVAGPSSTVTRAPVFWAELMISSDTEWA